MSAQTETHAPSLPAPPGERAGEAAAPRIVPVRRTGQWAAAVVVLILLAGALVSVVRNDAFQWDVVGAYLTTDSVLRGLGLTLWLTGLVMVLGFALGTLLAVLRLSGNRVLQAVSWGYIWLFRSTPILVQLLFWFNIGALYPQILGVSTVNLLGPVTVAVIGLTLHEAAYAAEVVRGGILSVERGQLEAAQSLGLGPWRRLRRIVLPQAMRSIVPPAGNMLIGTLKGTSIVSIIAVQDLLYSVQLVYHRTYEVIPLLLVATLWYVAVTSLLSIGQYYVERHYARGTAGTR
ncbi:MULTISPECIES: amino acid ABC transporter permease [Streptomyces]|uniref:Amino acid ABC transporter permease n=1 Tax=Streptomyces glycanivorans TaxID=3033808 RepID=A0ABY9JLG8_9ACTN|nr:MULTISPECIES: amino acid ABC transporter permease [unclassified Streptomyces]WSQ80819.1 amino acid ABC transporter permease [Streptomyces sp. NBC_01213]TXS10160.1 amino acid ABC transporter permease [Streptomyces sp. wa22]WLQ67393.1 amino acid ABC transporter permease [Streptomyces sp. Alt3]WSQ88149.1 amino acid ABC transporter permease [Streptomyces sp. NBC_01212]WSR05843.1 amino acid ABC transporter permease [Streptomyces sp. NBC_01208]